MGERARTPPTKDEMSVQHRPDGAQSHSSVQRTGADQPAHGMREPHATGTQAATDGGVRPRPEAEAGFAGPLQDDPRIQRIEKLAEWLDTRFVIPVINWPIGLDGILGLIPGVGDTVTAALSSYLIYEAHQAGARKGTLARMGWNVGVDWVLGTIPLVGDIFDVAHKANAKNARLLLDELRRAQGEARARAAERQGRGPT